MSDSSETPNERRIREGRFCLCEGDQVCDFHKRGGYTTHEDDVKPKTEEEFEVVWNGGPLLPDRLTKPSILWEHPRDKFQRKESEPGKETSIEGERNWKRSYNKRNKAYWSKFDKPSTADGHKEKPCPEPSAM